MLKKTSRLIVPNDSGYIKGVISYSNEISRRVGFSKKEIKEIDTALKEACINVITHAFDPYEDESFTITFDILRDGIKIVIDEMGLPFSPRFEEKVKDTPGLHVIEENMDKILYINRGKDGKELQLFKYLKGRHIEELFTEDELKPFDYCEILSKETEYSIRLMRPEEAIEVSRCIYRTYKYTYLNEDLYFPERIEEMNKDRRMISSVAVTNEDELVAHFGLLPRPDGKVAEIGAAVVVPQHRRRGLMQKLLDCLIKEAEKHGFIALFGDAFSIHTISQKTNLKFGFKETAIQLGAFPPKSIKLLTEKGLEGSGHVITFFKYLKESEGYKVFLPIQHQDILKVIYKNLGIKRTFGNPDESWAESILKESIIHLSFKPSHKTAIIEVRGYGKDLEKRIETKLIELTNKGFNAINLDLNLKDPFTPVAVRRLEDLGFFFSGLLPDYSEGDVLRLQYYNTEVNYDEIETVSPFAIELMDYIKGLDPKWRVLHT